jgi:hypothetical protein
MSEFQKVANFFGGLGPTIAIFLGFLLTIVFGIVPLLFGRKKGLSYFTREKTLISDSFKLISKFSAYYENISVNHLNVTDFYIWNSGNETINDIDLITENPLSLSSHGDGIIFDIQNLKNNNPATKRPCT